MAEGDLNHIEEILKKHGTKPEDAAHTAAIIDEVIDEIIFDALEDQGKLPHVSEVLKPKK